MSESDANRVITALHDHAIEAAKVAQPDGRWSIEVASADSIKALKMLNQNRILKGSETTSRERASVISSREEQRFQFERALSEEIERTISNLPGALEARVHLNMPIIDPLFGQKLSKDEGSGSVLLIAEKGSDIKSDQVAGLVAGASGIPAAKISVLISLAATGSREEIQPLLEPEKIQLTHSPRIETIARLGISPLELASSLLILGIGLMGLVLTRKRVALAGALKRLKTAR